MIKPIVTIGADPELFVYDKETNQYLSAHDLIPGTKSDPLEVPLGAVQVDGVAAEFNITPAKNRKEFMKNIKHVQNILDIMVKHKNKNYSLVGIPTVLFRTEYFDELPFLAKELGCEPDFNAYTGKSNTKPETKLPMRTGSGHIHIGWTEKQEPFSETHMSKCCDLVKQLDFALLHTSEEWDMDSQRRELYGAPGAFRPKAYGVEYRVLSNAWLNKDWSMEFVYDTVKALTMRWLKGYSILDAAVKYKIGPRDDYFKFSDFMYHEHLPSIDEYSPRLEAANIRRLRESRLAF